MIKKRYLPIGLFIAFFLSACSSLAALDAAPQEGALAPPFALETLQGTDLAIEDLRGEVVLVNFWATWCGPCRLEMPAIQNRFENHDFQVLAVNFDEPRERVQDFVDELGLGFTVLLDPGGEIQKLYQVRGYPSSYFVDRQGVIQIVHIGFMAEEQLDAYLAEMGVIN